ncbi:MAG: right-handed parallel beta-helix repeat-containing protein [Anaerolineae bacterium]|nr:right-handed parallel beta-helix repeat-containing protein [Anaerolineae bacterium]
MLVLVSIVAFMALGPAPRVAEAAGDNGYYVATDGNDSDPGTLSQPWRTVQHAVETVTAGDTIIIRAGAYDESVNFSVSGQEGAPIVLTAYQDELVTIDGGQYPALVDKNSTQYWTVEGFALDSDAGLTIDLGGWGWCETRHWIIRDNYLIGSIGITGSYNIVEGNEIDGSQHKGSEFGIREWTEASHHNLYRNNEIHHFYNRAIWSMYFTHDSVFEGNHIHDMGAQGIDLDGFSTVVWRHTVRNNHIHDCAQNGISLENAFDTVVENNIIHDNPGLGIEVINYGGEVGAQESTDDRCKAGGESGQYGDTDGDNDCRGNITGNIIRQNLIYNIDWLGAICIWYAGGVSVLGNTIVVGEGNNAAGINIGHSSPEIRIQNNIISECDWGAINVQSTDSLAEDSHNLLSQSGWRGDYRIADTDYDLVEYQSMTVKGQSSIAADPGFIDQASADFRLLADSPAIDAGTDIGLATDLNGGSRPQGLDYDIGTFEYTGPLPPTPTPLPPTPTPTPTIALPAEIALHSGWNLVSVPVHPSDTSAEAVLSTIAGEYDLVYAYDASDEASPWKQLDPSVPSFANDLLTIDETKGLWLHGTSATTWTFPDYTPPAGIIPLHPGWNLVGYPSSDAKPVAEALASIEGKYTLVYTQDPSDQVDPWKMFNPAAPPWSNELTQMVPGCGYWILITQPCELSLNGAGDPVSSQYRSQKVDAAAYRGQADTVNGSTEILEPPPMPGGLRGPIQVNGAG